MSFCERNERRRRRALIGSLGLAAAGALLGGCGFRPLYARSEETGYSTVDELRAIRIEPLEDRTGQQLHNLLRDRLNPLGQPTQPLYYLDVVLSETTRELALRSDETATRADLDIVAQYTLKLASEPRSVFVGTSRAINSFNILQSQFATQVSEEDARSRGLRELAVDIRAQLAIFFARARET